MRVEFLWLVIVLIIYICIYSYKEFNFVHCCFGFVSILYECMNRCIFLCVPFSCNVKYYYVLKFVLFYVHIWDILWHVIFVLDIFFREHQMHISFIDICVCVCDVLKKKEKEENK